MKEIDEHLQDTNYESDTNIRITNKEGGGIIRITNLLQIYKWRKQEN